MIKMSVRLLADHSAIEFLLELFVDNCCLMLKSEIIIKANISSLNLHNGLV